MNNETINREVFNLVNGITRYQSEVDSSVSLFSVARHLKLSGLNRANRRNKIQVWAEIFNNLPINPPEAKPSPEYVERIQQRIIKLLNGQGSKWRDEWKLSDRDIEISGVAKEHIPEIKQALLDKELRPVKKQVERLPKVRVYLPGTILANNRAFVGKETRKVEKLKNGKIIAQFDIGQLVVLDSDLVDKNDTETIIRRSKVMEYMCKDKTLPEVHKSDSWADKVDFIRDRAEEMQSVELESSAIDKLGKYSFAKKGRKNVKKSKPFTRDEVIETIQVNSGVLIKIVDPE